MNIEKLKYPIGKFVKPEIITDEYLKKNIQEIEVLPSLLFNTVTPLTETQLNTPYRPQGWTVRQVVHHIADSHINAYIRCHWTLTEDNPTIKPYFEALWAELPDGKEAPIELSLDILTSIHKRWVYLLKHMNQHDFLREYIHPEYGKIVALNEYICLYAWHGKHHLTHITELIKRNFDQNN